MKYKKAVKELKAIANDRMESELTRDVASMLIDEAEGYETIDSFFNDLFQYGCQSGMIGSLIYYTDTHAFAKKHIEDIMELKQEYNAQGMELNEPTDEDALNWLAWFAFEEQSRIIAGTLGIDW